MSEIATQVVFPERGVIRVEQHPVPAPGPEQIVIRVRRVGICATDLHLLEGHIGDPFPLVPGHEFVGEVVAIGPDAAASRGLGIGDRVSVEMLLPCRTCSRCREGRYNLCERDLDPTRPAGRQLGVNIPADAGGRFSGGYATHLLVPAEAIVHRLPDTLPWDVAVLVEPLAVAFRTLSRGRVTAGERVTVIGPGPVGLLVTAAARSVGAEVTVRGTRPERLEMALAMGADQVALSSSPLPADADVSIECAGTPDAQAQAIRAVRRGGRVVLAGACGSGRRLSVDPDDDLLTREIDLLPSFLSAHGYEPAVALLTREPARFAPLVTHRFALADVAEAFEAVRDRSRGVMKAVLVP